MTRQEKGLLQSKTVWGAVVAALPFLDAVLVGTGSLEAGLLTETAEAITSAAGAILAVWGRWTASKSIKGLL